MRRRMGRHGRWSFPERLESSGSRFVNAFSKCLPAPYGPSHSSFVCSIVAQIGGKTNEVQPLEERSSP